MKIPAFIIAIFLGAIIGLQSWALTEIVAMKVSIVEYRCRCSHAAADSQYGQSPPTAPAAPAQNRFEFTHK